MIEICKKIVDFMINKSIIPARWTGKILIEININQGGITDAKVLPELRFK